MSRNKPKLLITGVSGFLGWNLATLARDDWQVTGLYHSRPIEIDGVDTFPCDLGDQQSLTDLFEKIRPDALIHLAAISSPNVCEENPQRSRQINVRASEILASLCKRHQVAMVFTSSSQVYSGDHPPYTERSPTHPLNAYGQQKLDAEQAIRSACPTATICRVPLMYGAAPEGATSSLYPVLHALRSGQPGKLFTDEIRSALGAHSASEGLLNMLTRPGELYLLAGEESLSRYAFGLRVAAFLKLDHAPLIPTEQAALTMAAKRPANLTMDCSKARSAGFRPRSIEEELSYALSLGA
ncbi:MAG: SDR family oxidoreductase [Gammaproteobacteria bacterium]|nr:SDR family oxidoreductase [Gammaproteobacteria bacterium]